MKLKNISKETQLVLTVDGKKEIKAGEIFDAKNGESLLKNYKGYFEAVKKDEVKDEKKAEKVVKSKSEKVIK